MTGLDPAAHPCCQVLELRQYALRPGGRETLSNLFECHFLDALEQTGMHVSGLFADLDDQDRLVWWRGFPDMAARHRALSDFYLHGAVWREHRTAANATMVDSDDVLLLRPTYVGPSYPDPAAPRLAAPVSTSRPLVVDVVGLDRMTELSSAATSWTHHLLATAETEDAEVLLAAETHPEPNDFPGLPVREERVAVWMVRYPDQGARRQLRDRLGLQDSDERVALGALAGSQIG